MKYSSRYPGVKPFKTEEQQIFFGRDADIQALYNLFGVEKTVLFYSKSGLGKTSLINAGLIPKLLEDKNITYNPVIIRLGIFHPKLNHKSPKEKIIDLLQKTAYKSFFKKFPALYENTIAYCLKSIQFYDPGKTNVLMFDQFEELFTYPDDQVKELKKELNEILYLKTSTHFSENLLHLSETEPDAFSEKQLNILTSALNIRMLFAIRSEKLSLMNLLTDYLPNLLRTFYELKPLEEKEARDAINEPAKKEGFFSSAKFEFTKESIDKIINALSNNKKQPIATFQLQIVCQYAESLVLNNPGHQKIAPPDLGNIQDIYKLYYDNLITGLPIDDNERLNLRKLLEEKFIDEPEQRRIPVLKGMILRNISENTLRLIEDSGLIHSEPYEDTFNYELSHDTLVEPILKSYHKRQEENEKRREEEIRKLEEEKMEFERRKAEEKRIEEEKKIREALEIQLKEKEIQLKDQELLASEIKRLASEKELQDIRIKEQRQRKIIMIVSFAALISICCAVLAFYMFKKAESAHQEKQKYYNNFVEEHENAEKANQKLIDFESKQKKELEVQRLISDAKSYEMYGYIPDAVKSIERALKLDSSNTEAITLMHSYLKP